MNVEDGVLRIRPMGIQGNAPQMEEKSNGI